MNVPNQLTVSRFVLTVAFLLVVFSSFPYHESIALLLFSAASLTDKKADSTPAPASPDAKGGAPGALK